MMMEVLQILIRGRREENDCCGTLCEGDVTERLHSQFQIHKQNNSLFCPERNNALLKELFPALVTDKLRNGTKNEIW